MNALPFDAVWTPPALALAVTLAWAWLMPGLLGLLIPGIASDGMRRAMAAGVLVLGTVAGYSALGPSLVEGPFPLYGLAIGLLGAGVASLRAPANGKPAPTLALVLGFCVAAIPALAWKAAQLATRVDDPMSVSPARAGWHRTLDPWNADALLALAWNAQRSEHLERAEALRRLAVRAGLEGAPAAELEAELLAMAGDCSGARHAFDRALAARAATALETFDLRLEGAYRLPETFVRRCGLVDDEPMDVGLSDELEEDGSDAELPGD